MTLVSRLTHGPRAKVLWSCVLAALALLLALVVPARGATPGAPWAWGDNSFFQLDDWTTVNRHTPVPMRDFPEGVTALAGGDNHTLALKADGTVWAWGYNFEGAVGNGRRNDVMSPTQVFAGAVAIAAGMDHSLARKADGTVWAWGNNDGGNLGDGTRLRRTSPVQVRDLNGVTAIAAGWVHSLALKDGTVWAWGDNDDGQLGDGTRTLRTSPVQVNNLTAVRAIAAGWHHNLALREDGTVWAWGDNANGDLGDGTMTVRTTPVQVGNLSGVTAITAGASHSLALKADGTVWAWGYKLMGSTLDPQNISTTPVQVPELSEVTAIAAGHIHNLVLMKDGTVRSWGSNAFGQLGDDTTADQRTPVSVRNLSAVKAIAGGGSHSLAITATPPAASPLDACRLLGWACTPQPQFTRGSILLACDRPNCIVIDRVPKNCEMKYSCPGCVAGGMCPPVYQMSFEGLRGVWTVGLYDVKGRTVPHDRVPTRTGVVLSFRPSKEQYIKGRIGDYILVFQMGPKGIPGVKYRVRTRLGVSDRPYEPPKPDRSK